MISHPSHDGGSGTAPPVRAGGRRREAATCGNRQILERGRDSEAPAPVPACTPYAGTPYEPPHYLQGGGGA